MPISIVFVLTRRAIEPVSTASAADALTTRHVQLKRRPLHGLKNSSICFCSRTQNFSQIP